MATRLPPDQAARVKRALRVLRATVATDAALADMLSIKPPSLHEILHGEGGPSYETAKAVARRVGVPVADLLSGAGGVT